MAALLKKCAVADIDGSAFHPWRRPLVLQITAFWVQAIPG
jgi:hypothetical protein